MNHIVLDLEWNQPRVPALAVTDPFFLKGEIFQIGAVKLDESFSATDTFNGLIKPVYYRKMHSKVKQLTGVSSEKLSRGDGFGETVRRFLDWCGDCDFFTWGPDDVPMLRDNLIIHKIPATLPAYYDLQLIFDHQITRQHRQFSLAVAAESVGETLTDAHDALSDATATALLCRHLDMKAGLRDYPALYGQITPPSVFNKPVDGKFRSKRELISKCCTKTLDHPVTGKLELEGWRFGGLWKLFASGTDRKGAEYFVSVKMAKKDDGFTASLSAHPMNKKLRETFDGAFRPVIVS